MADERTYRLLVKVNPETEKFTAEVPEMGIEVIAETRVDAVDEAEKEIESKIAEAAGGGEPVPEPSDVSAEAQPITLSLVGPLHRDLLFHAKAAGMEPNELANQLLCHALGSLVGRRQPRPKAAEGEERRENRGDREEGNSHHGRGKRRGRYRKEGYRPDLDDKANFLEYLRGLDRSGGGRGR